MAWLTLSYKHKELFIPVNSIIKMILKYNKIIIIISSVHSGIQHHTGYYLYLHKNTHTKWGKPQKHGDEKVDWAPLLMVCRLFLLLYGLFLGKAAVLNLTQYGFYGQLCLISVPPRAAWPAPLTLSLCTECKSQKSRPSHAWAGPGKQHTPTLLPAFPEVPHATGSRQTLPIINKALCAPTWNSVHILPRVLSISAIT